MLTHTWTRFGSFFRESAIIRGSFSFADSGDVWSVVSTNRFSTYNGFTATDAGTGRVTIAFPKCRQVEVMHASIRQTVGTFSNLRQIELPPMTDTIANAGSFELNLYLEDGTSGVPALADPADGSILALVLWCAR